MRERNRVVTLLPGYTAAMFEDYKDGLGDPPWVRNWPSGTGSVGPVTESQYCQDEVVPGWKDILDRGGILNNPYLKTTEVYYPPNRADLEQSIARINDQGFRLERHRYGTVVPFGMSVLNGSALPPLLTGSIEIDQMRQRVTEGAVTKAFANIAVPDILAGATLAEGNKTIKSMVDITKRAIKLARAIKKIDRTMAQHAWYYATDKGRKSVKSSRILRRELSLNKIEDDYMQARYAIRPIIYDVNGIIRAIQRPSGEVRRTARGLTEGTEEVSDTLHNIPFWHDCNVDLKRVYMCEISARAGVLYSHSVNWASVSGCSELATSAWELLPTSFIWDWVWNIGDTIAAHAPKVGVKQLASWVTIKEKWSQINSLDSVRLNAEVISAWPLVHTCTLSAFDYGIRKKTTVRTTNPQLRIFPQLSINLDRYKLLDLGIILKKLI